MESKGTAHFDANMDTFAECIQPKLNIDRASMFDRKPHFKKFRSKHELGNVGNEHLETVGYVTCV